MSLIRPHVLTLILLGLLISSVNAQEDVSKLAAAWKASTDAETAGQYDQAITKLREFENLGGDAYLVALRNGWLAYAKKDYVNAAKFYRAASNMQPQSINALLGRMNTALAVGDYKESRTVADSILRIDPAQYSALSTVASAFYAEKNYGQALTYYRRINDYYPEDTTGLSGTAWSLLLNGDARTAAAEFKKLLSISPTFAYAQQGYEQATGKKLSR
ncbi:MAG: tetratricopeptide repeat protein [Verrucomicrobiae bacterium]|nr:tetratricopeptide repeat protein [Verrucomicrobiae bacterium]